MPRKGLSKDAKYTIIAAVVIGMSAFIVPEVRQFFHLEEPPQKSPPKPAFSFVQDPPPQTVTEPKSEPPKTEPTTIQKTTTKVKGDDNVAGNNVNGNHNVTGNNNQTAPIAIAPNGIAISGGNVQNPTVNNITALPDLMMYDAQEKQVTDSLDQTFADVEVSIMEVQPSRETRDFSERLARILRASGANVELSSASSYTPPAGQTLHKGMAITSFPPERKSIVDKFVNALGTAKVVPFVTIYKQEDKKVNIVVNRSMDTLEEGKQY